jgi:hypothetical protein
MAVVNQITAWSYSRYQQYKKCPFASKCSIILKIKEPSNEAMERGNRIHKLAEDHTKGQIKELPPELSKFKAKFAALRRYKAKAEDQWTFTKAWAQTSWFAADAWLRIKVDVHFLKAKGKILEIDDHKTGKIHDEHAEQRSLYALGGFLIYPKVEVIDAAHLYLDNGQEQKDVFTREQLPILQEEWVDKTRGMLNDTRFAPTPGYQCRWCFFSKSKNGPCQY